MRLSWMGANLARMASAAMCLSAGYRQPRRCFASTSHVRLVRVGFESEAHVKIKVAVLVKSGTSGSRDRQSDVVSRSVEKTGAP